MLTNDNLLLERPHHLGNGVQRIYVFGNYGLSVVNDIMLHSYEFAWEIAVVRWKEPPTTERFRFNLVYEFDELTNDVVVCFSDEETQEFISRA